VEPEEAAIARHWAGKHASVATDMHTTIEELRDVVCVCVGFFYFFIFIVMSTIGMSVGSQQLAVVFESVVTVGGWPKAWRNLRY
jgi:hypothetical protein